MLYRLRMPSVIAVLLLLSLSFSGNGISAKSLIDPMKHDIFSITAPSFSATIGQFRNDQVATLLFYNKGEESKKLINGLYNTFAKDLKGQVKVAAINCDEYGAFCSENKVETYPSVMIYPPNPIPAYIYQKPLELKALTSLVMGLIPGGHTVMLDTMAKHDKLMAENIAVPKVILFSDKKSAPPLYRALVNSFKDRLAFAFVEASATAMTKLYKIEKYPTLLCVKPSAPKPDRYTGEMKFKPLHEWLNVRSETFVKGGGFSDETRIEDTRVWLVQKVPEVTKLSHQDICFKKEGLCVMYLTDGPIPDDTISVLEDLNTKHSTGNRGVNFRWMWMNLETETNFKALFEVTKFPSVVVFNPHKRLRWTALPSGETATPEAISHLLEKIAGGDARFTTVKGGKLPAFADRRDAGKNKEEL